MTKDFRNQRQENTGPFSRNISSGRYREDRPSRSARPRLSRDAVDRGWENGASRAHADYRPRQSANRPPFQRSGQSTPAFERSRQPYNHRSSETRRQSYDSPSSSFNQNGYQPRREPSPRTGPRRFNEPGQRVPGNRPGLSSERWTREGSSRSDGSISRYQDRDQSQARGPSRFDQRRPGDPGRQDYREDYRPRPFERHRREEENFARGRRTYDPRTRRDSYNPPRQSRPTTRRGYSEARQQYQGKPADRSPSWQGKATDRPGSAQFEGDYEQFDEPEQVEYPEQPPQQPYEKHVTRLPDGRVLKGSRPQQREQARFWNEVEEETENLMPRIPVAPKKRKQETTANRPARLIKQPGSSKAHKIKRVKTARARDGASRAEKAKTGKKKADGTPGSVIRPFQRGYKWPATGE